jgi:hypothetical protein
VVRIVFFGIGAIVGALVGAFIGDVFMCFNFAAFTMLIATCGAFLIPDSIETNEFAVQRQNSAI